MNSTELKALIKESLQEVFAEGKNQDPTKEEMMHFLQQQFGRYGEEGFADSAEVAMYWFANHYHGGQWSNLYSVLSTSQFSPGPISRGPEPESMEADMYQSLEAEYGGKEHQHGTEGPHPGEDDALEEDGAAAPAASGATTTSHVQGYMTPKAFKHPKDVPAHQMDEAEEEDPLYVEYHSQRQGEEPFMFNGQKYEYVNAKYPNGKTDIGVYVFGQDLVVSYKTFQNWLGIKEEEQPEMHDAETDQFAPGPRQRPEDWKPSGQEPPKQLPINESVPKRILKLKDLLK